MAHIALFRKYRSQAFEDLSGQDHIRRTLRNALRLQRIAQAYLFCGPRGTGKTSSARIFAKALNCVGTDPARPLQDPPEEPCNTCSLCRSITDGSCLDVTEIDAASHTGVDNIREVIISKADFAPVEGRRKVYIIDEVHKLSAGAFNALLKTLEEPPEHLVFILATTDPDEVPQTILSRCQRFEFRRISKADMMARMAMVCAQEGFEASDEALEVLAQAADGAMRDALVLLEQAAAFGEGKVDMPTVVSMLGLTGREVLARLVEVLLARQVEPAITLLGQLFAEGKDPLQLGEDLLRHLRALMLVRVSGVRAVELLRVGDDVVEALQGQAQQLDLGGWMRLIKEVMELVHALRDPAQARLQWEVAIIRWMTQGSERPASAGLAAALPASGHVQPAMPAPSSAPAPSSPPPVALSTPPPPARVEALPAAPALGGRQPAFTPSAALGGRQPAFGAAPAPATPETPALPPGGGSVHAAGAEVPAPSAHPAAVAPGLSNPVTSAAVPPAARPAAGVAACDLGAFARAWERMLGELNRERRMPLLGVLREARPLRVQGDICYVAVAPHLKFHQDKIEKERGELSSRLTAALGVQVRLAVDASGAPAPAAEPAMPSRVGAAQHEAFVHESLGIFGGEVVS